MYKILLLITIVTGISGALYAQKNNRLQQFNLDHGLAIKGYDPVAYFTVHKAVMGDKKFAASADGVLYYFSSAENKALFLKNYRQYEPQYGGWCAYAMGASHEKVDIDPETFKILNNKLYLFYHSWTNNTLTKWNKEEERLKQSADEYWATIFH
jgi:YHS domain-containing protein